MLAFGMAHIWFDESPVLSDDGSILRLVNRLAGQLSAECWNGVAWLPGAPALAALYGKRLSAEAIAAAGLSGHSRDPVKFPN
jgi:hypothetical protein